MLKIRKIFHVDVPHLNRGVESLVVQVASLTEPCRSRKGGNLDRNKEDDKTYKEYGNDAPQMSSQDLKKQDRVGSI
jgi:hypothetical protein